MKLLIYAPIKYPNAEIDYILVLARRLKLKGVESVVMAPHSSPMFEMAHSEGFRIEGQFNLLTLNPVRLLQMRAPLKDWLEQEKFDIVDVHRSEGFALMARLVKRLKHKPALIRTRQDMRPARTDPINRWTYNSADMVIVSNRLLADDLITRLRLNPERVRVIYYGVNPENFQPTMSSEELRKAHGIGRGSRLIGISARLGIVKGHQYFLKAAEQVANQISDARFLVSYRMIEKESDFLTLVSKSPLKDRFLIFGPCDNRADLLSLCEVGVLSSVGSEASSRACLEWMALKKPVVVTRVGVLPELVKTGDTGYLVMPRDAKGMAEAILKLLHHPDRAKQMGEAGYRLLKERFTEDIMIEQTLASFSKVLGRSGVRAGS